MLIPWRLSNTLRFFVQLCEYNFTVKAKTCRRNAEHVWSHDKMGGYYL